jgi:glutathione S-transferase
MPYCDIVVGLALIEYLVFGYLVGDARKRYGIRAPAVTGHAVFERHYRAHMNTLELLIVFLPGMLLFARYVSPLWAAAVGILFVIGRAWYYRAYVADPDRRHGGFALSFLAIVILLAGGLIGALGALLR